jgi:hypothetical protein
MGHMASSPAKLSQLLAGVLDGRIEFKCAAEVRIGTAAVAQALARIATVQIGKCESRIQADRQRECLYRQFRLAESRYALPAF